MRKIYYISALVCLAFASCKPLSKTYSDIDAAPISGTIALNLTSAEYKTLSSTAYPYTSFNFNSATDANLYIPTILNAKYPTAPNLTAASVTFALAPASSSIASPDLTYAHIAIVLGPTDYVFPGNTFANFSASTALNYLAYRYPTPSANQMVVMTYNYFETGVTASAGTIVTDTFVYLNNAWTKLYTVSPAQYASINRGNNNWFVTGDVANLVFYLSNFLEADQTVMATAKTGDSKYVSYRLNTTSQMVLTLTYNGSSWVPKQTLSFLKLNGAWVPDPTVYITLPDNKTAYNTITALVNNTVIKPASLANLLSFGDFDLKADASQWSDSDINIALALVLQSKISSPVIGVPYSVTYYVYTGATTTASKVFLYNGTTFAIRQ